jgi:hypothetical protein
VFFFWFWKNMTFDPSGPMLATGWNGLEPSWLKGFFFLKIFFGERLEMEFQVGEFIFFQGDFFWLQGSDFCRLSGSCLFS